MKHMNRRNFLAGTGAGAALLTLAPKAALAQGWPARPITIVIQYGAGGGTDTIIRALVQALEKSFDVGLRAVNQPGAAGALATDAVLSRPADGYWLLGGAEYNKFFRVLGYAERAPWMDWQFMKIGRSLPAWAVVPDSPYKTMTDVIEAARANPGTVRISNAGVGTIWHEATLLALEMATGARFNHVPYNGGAPAALAALQGEVDVVGSGVHEQVEYLRAGQLRNIGVFLTEALEIDGVADPLPAITESIPNAADLGLAQGVYGLAVRRDTDPATLRVLSDAVEVTVADESFAAILNQRVMFPDFLTGAAADREAAQFESITSWLYHEIEMEGMQHSPADLGIPRPEDFAAYWPPAGYKPVL